MSSGYLTRIQNNQITDSTINAANKILPGSIQGNLLAASVTFNSNITILGNLTVSNSYTQLNSINTYINDPIVVFNNGYSGSLTNYDIGILVNRNLASLGAYGSVNTFLGWSESAQAFIGIATTETGTSVSSINNSGYANLVIGNASLVSATITNNLTVGSFTAPTSTLTTLNATTGNVITLVATNFSTANAVITGGSITGDSSGTFTTLQGTNFSTGNAVISGGSLSGITNLNATTATATNFASGNAVITGGAITGTPISGSTGYFTTAQATNFSSANAVITGGSVNVASVTAGPITGTTLLATSGFSTANAVITGGSLNNLSIGATTASTGAFTTLTTTGTAIHNGNIVAASGTSSTNTTTGALVVVGGAGVSGNLNVAGLAAFTDAVPTTGPNTGALQVTSGGAYISGNLWVGGNINFTPNSVSTISGNSAQFFGNAAGFGAIYAGISSGYVVQPQTVIQNSTNFNGYAQVNHQNINSGTSASTDFVATADTGTAGAGFIDMGINSSGFVGGAGNELNYPLDGYLLVTGTTSTNGNLLISTNTGADIVFSANGQGFANEIGRFQFNSTGNSRLLIKATTPSTSTTSGALTVAGGAGIAGAVYAGSVFDNGNRVLSTSSGSGNLSISGTAVTLTATGPGATTVGSATSVPVITTDAYGRVSALSSASINTGFTLNGTSGTSSVTGGSTLSLAGTYGVTVTVGTEYANIATPQDLRTTASPTFTGLQATTLATTNFSSGNAVITGGSVNGSPIGATSASTGAFTTLTTTGTAIAGGNVVAAATTVSTNTTTGALVVAGGVGVAGDMNVGGNLKVSGTLTYINTTTELVSGIEIVAGNLVANSGTASSNTTTGALVIAGGAGISGAVNIGGALTAGSITGTPISGSTGTFTTAQATNFSSGNAQITGGYASGLANVYATTAQATNFSTGNAQITGGSLSGITNLNVTTETATNFASGNAQITGGAITGTPISGSTGTFTTAQATNFSTGNAVISGGYISSLANATITTGTLTTLVATNFSTANAVITGGSITGDSSGTFTTLQGTNFSTGNAVISGGSLSGITNLNATTATATNFASGNAVITGGSANGLTTLSATTATVTNFSTGNAQISNGSGAFTALQGTTTQATNFSTANAVITGGHIDGTSVGLYTPSTGAFTTLNASGATTLNTLSTTGTAIHNGNIVAAAGTGSVSTTTGAMVVVGGMGVSGNINAGNSSALHQISGNLLLGLGTASASALTTLEVNQNAGVPQSSTSVVHVSALSGQTGKITLDSFGSASSIGGSAMILRTSAGTSASPSAVQQGQTLGGFIARGYGATGFLLANIALSAGMIVQADQNFTDTAQGTKLNFNVIPLGSNVAISAITIGSNGNVLINQGAGSTSTTTGALVVNGGVGISNNINVGGTSTVTGVATFQANVVITSQAVSSSTTTGALVIPAFGGAGIGGNLNVGGNAYVGGISYLGPISNSISLTNPIMVGTGNGNNTVQVSIQNTNTGASASTDYVATADNGSDTTHYIDMGINSSGFNGPANGWTISGASDGYLYVDAGNLTLGTDTVGKNVAVHVGGTFANNIVATFNANSIGATSTTATAVINGGLTLTGTAGNLYVAGTGGTTYTSGVIVNHGQASAGTTGASNQNAFIVQGANDSTLLYAKPLTAYDAVIIGGNGASTSFTQGAKLVINSTDSILLPVGSNAGRPSNSGGTDVAGMFRYSTTAGAIEYYNGTTWTSPSSAFTVIADQQFTGTGSQTAFTLNTAQTTASCIVSINGIVQIPTSAYSVSGTTLTFTEAPQSTDIIDVRQLTTTVTVTSLSDSTGYNSVLVTSSGVQITTGTSTANVIASYTTGGAVVNSTPNVTVASSSVATTVDSFYANTYSSAEYTVTATIQGTNIRQIAKVLVVTDGTNAYVTPYGITSTAGNTLATFGGNVSAGSVNFQATATNANTILRMHKQYQAV